MHFRNRFFIKTLGNTVENCVSLLITAHSDLHQSKRQRLHANECGTSHVVYNPRAHIVLTSTVSNAKLTDTLPAQFWNVSVRPVRLFVASYSLLFLLCRDWLTPLATVSFFWTFLPSAMTFLFTSSYLSSALLWIYALAFSVHFLALAWACLLQFMWVLTIRGEGKFWDAHTTHTHYCLLIYKNISVYM